jgi:hypothetical protein
MFWHALVLGKTLAQNRNVFGFICFLEEIFVSQRQRRQDTKICPTKANSLKAKDSKEKEARQPFLFFYL